MIGISERLRHAREQAGFASASSAASRYQWVGSTYIGHENGNRGIKDATVGTYAHAFNVSVEWLRYGTGNGPGKTPKPDKPIPVSGFSDGDISPFSPSTDRARTTIEHLATQIAPKIRTRSLYQAGRNYFDLAILSGDVLVLETKANARPGDIVIVNVADEKTGSARTSIRRYAPPLLMAGLGEANDDLGAGNAVVLGIVAAVIRPQSLWDKP